MHERKYTVHSVEAVVTKVETTQSVRYERIPPGLYLTVKGARITDTITHTTFVDKDGEKHRLLVDTLHYHSNEGFTRLGGVTVTWSEGDSGVLGYRKYDNGEEGFVHFFPGVTQEQLNKLRPMEESRKKGMILRTMKLSEEEKIALREKLRSGK